MRRERNQQLNEPSRHSKNIWAIVATVILSVLVEGCAVLSRQQNALENIKNEPSVDWNKYLNEKYAYEINVPQEWEIIEAIAMEEGAATAARPEGILVEPELQKVMFLEHEYIDWQGQFQIRVLPNPNY